MDVCTAVECTTLEKVFVCNTQKCMVCAQSGFLFFNVCWAHISDWAITRLYFAISVCWAHGSHRILHFWSCNGADISCHTTLLQVFLGGPWALCFSNFLMRRNVACMLPPYMQDMKRKEIICFISTLDRLISLSMGMVDSRFLFVFSWLQERFTLCLAPSTVRQSSSPLCYTPFILICISQLSTRAHQQPANRRLPFSYFRRYVLS